MPTTAYQVIRPTGPVETFTVELSKQPGFTELDAIIKPHLDGGELEHVYVLHDGKQRDMFVDDSGTLKRLPFNRAATEIYRAATIAKRPATRPETLPAIYGTAVIFARPVWF